MKPSLPQGTRDFSADVVRKRNFIFNTIRQVFELYGFQPLETPSMENLETLTGKYGEEGDKLIFKILNNGLENPAKHVQAQQEFSKILDGRSSKGLTERALRYDLTIPFARYVAMNFGQLTMPFKRYQIQPVWRADRPQKGRYREFYQCDADIVGSRNILNEIEFTALYQAVFQRLNLQVDIRINSRKILAAIAALCGGAEKMTDITVAIDKLDKIGMEKVKEELLQRNLQPAQVATIEKYLLISGSNTDKLAALQTLIGHLEMGKQGIEDLRSILAFLPAENTGNVITDFTLARGLNYYTGIIFEVKAKGVQMGSIGGGGRYDDLTSLFGVPNVAGVGISFGVDRIYDVMEELQLFPPDVQAGTEVLFFNLGMDESKNAYKLVQALRTEGIATELYPENTKFDKQFKYADKKGIVSVVIIGSQELQDGTCTVKNLATGEQKTILQTEVLQHFATVKK